MKTFRDGPLCDSRCARSSISRNGIDVLDVNAVLAKSKMGLDGAGVVGEAVFGAGGEVVGEAVSEALRSRR